jgi:hypothetical protein
MCRQDNASSCCCEIPAVITSAWSKFPAWDEAKKQKLLANWYDYSKAYRREIERFQTRIKRAKVLGLHSTEHGTFVFEEN